MEKLRVSVALHYGEPADDGNQADAEARYGGYNRQYAHMAITPDGAVVENAVFQFPEVQNHAERLTHFSFGDPNGGAIIITGPINPPIDVDAAGDNRFPQLNLTMVGVKLDKLRVLGMINDDGNIVTNRPAAGNTRALTDANATDAIK